MSVIAAIAITIALAAVVLLPVWMGAVIWADRRECKKLGIRPSADW